MVQNFVRQTFAGYSCSLCGADYGPQEVQYVCPKDGGNLNVVLDYRRHPRVYQR